jgi:SsrA-binding protein
MAKKKNSSIIADNRRARHEYAFDESLECGIELKGTEVKSVKSNKFSFSDAYARIRDQELWLIGLHVTPYIFGNIHNHDPDRDRKLLAHKQEIKRLKRKVDEKGYTLIPLNFHLKDGKVKVQIGLGKGKRAYDKRETIKRRDQKREAEREIRSRMKY